MNIVIIGATTYDGLEFHLQHACEQLGHGCEIIDYFAGQPIPTRYIRYGTLASEWFDLSLSRRVLKRIHRSQPDLIICTYRDIHPRLIADLKTRDFRVIHLTSMPCSAPQTAPPVPNYPHFPKQTRSTLSACINA